MKIVIVGGGSSGWIAAATLLGVPKSDITVIESPTIPKIGVGESTIDGFINWMNLLGIDVEAMMRETNATIKLGIKFEDFLTKDHHFYYPFGVYGIEKKYYEIWEKRRFLNPENHHSFADTFFPNMALIRNNTFTKNGQSFPHNSHALHFDASKFGPWLWEHYCKPRGAKRIEMNVKHIKTGDIGIEWLELDNGEKVTADLFIDCTGFKSLLLEGALNEPFLDYSNVLPNNMAWATHIHYLDKEKELVSYTNCTAVDNGWIWNIPLWTNIGTGYVYSNKFVSDEEALDEFKKHIQKTGRNPDMLEYKRINMKNGIHERLWVKNVVAIGLSGGFIEPLESTGLWFSHEYAYSLLRILYRGMIPTQHDRDTFNFICKYRWNDLVKFVCQHYALSGRTDTEYWRFIASTQFPLEKEIIVTSFQNERYCPAWPGIHSILAGFEYHMFDETFFWQMIHPKNADWKNLLKPEFDELDSARKSWVNEAQQSPKLLTVLNRIHNNF
jgi:tryptophan halogenase